MFVVMTLTQRWKAVRIENVTLSINDFLLTETGREGGGEEMVDSILRI